MKVTCEKLQDSQVLLQIEVEPERSAKSLDQAYRRVVNRVAIPGFRKGKAPRHLVERLVGHDALVQEGIDLLLPEVFREAVAETGIDPIDQPEIDIVQQAPLVVKLTVPVRPTVELGDYRDVHAEREPVTVRDEDIASTMQHLREEHAEWLPVDRPAAAGDRVTMDVTARVRGLPVLYDPKGEAILERETGEPIIDQKGAEYTIVLQSAAPVVGFAEQLVGLKAGEEKRFELNFPPDYPDAQYANKAAIFHVIVQTVKEQRLPELDDDFAKSVGEYDTLEALRKSVIENLQQVAERNEASRLAERVLNMLNDRAHIDLPSVLIEREIERLSSRAEERLQRAKLTMDQYLIAAKKTKEQLRAEYRTDAIANLRRYLILEEVAKLENLVVSADDVDAEIRKIGEALGGYGPKAMAAMKEPDRRDDLEDELRHRKAMARLVAIATGEDESLTDTAQSQTEVAEAE